MTDEWVCTARIGRNSRRGYGGTPAAARLAAMNAYRKAFGAWIPGTLKCTTPRRSSRSSRGTVSGADAGPVRRTIERHADLLERSERRIVALEQQVAELQRQITTILRHTPAGGAAAREMLEQRR